MRHYFYRDVQPIEWPDVSIARGRFAGCAVCLLPSGQPGKPVNFSLEKIFNHRY